MENDTKRVPKWNQHRCNKSSKTNAKTRIEQHHGNHQKHFFLTGGSMQNQYKQNIFEGFAGCVRDQKSMKKTSKMISKPIPKTMKNLYKFHDRQRRTKNDAKGSKWRHKVIPKLDENCKECDPEGDRKYIQKILKTMLPKGSS